MPTREEIDARRDAMRAREDDAVKAQELIDDEALADAEETHGFSAVGAVKIPFTPGLPVTAIVRRPSKIEFKRWTDSISKKDAASPEYMRAAEQLAAVCLVYPPKEVYEQMCEKCPGLKVPLGLVASKLASGRELEDAKK